MLHQSEKADGEKNFISIIVPVYKAEKYLAKCVDSILSQSYPHFELLLVDDGSPDDSPALCDLFATRDKRIKVSHKPNGGAASARNYGLDHAVGTYVLFIDADDYIPPNHLAVFIAEAKHHNADIVCGGVDYVPGPRAARAKEIMDTWQFIEAVLYRDNVADYPISKLYHRRLFDDIRFVEGITSEDFEIFYRLYLRAKTIVVTDETTYFYVQHSTSVSNHGFETMFFNRLDICEALIVQISKDHPSSLPAAYSRAVDEAISLYGITPRRYRDQRFRMKRIVRQYGHDVLRDPKTTAKVRRKVKVFNVSPLLWKLRMKLKLIFISVWEKGKCRE